MFSKNTCDLPHATNPEATERRGPLLASSTVEALAETFRVLGDPTRVRILDALAAGPLCVCDIAALAGISESAVSHQLRLLRGMRLVRPRRAGRHIFYSLDDQHILQLLTLAATHVEESRGSQFAVRDSQGAEDRSNDERRTTSSQSPGSGSSSRQSQFAVRGSDGARDLSNSEPRAANRGSGPSGS